MLTKIFTKNENGKIEFTEIELKELLDEVYNYGYNEGKKHKNYIYMSPHWTDITDITKPYWTYTPTTTTISKGETIYDTNTSKTVNIKGEIK